MNRYAHHSMGMSSRTVLSGDPHSDHACIEVPIEHKEAPDECLRGMLLVAAAAGGSLRVDDHLALRCVLVHVLEAQLGGLVHVPNVDVLPRGRGGCSVPW